MAPSPSTGRGVGLRGPCSSGWGARNSPAMFHSWMGRAGGKLTKAKVDLLWAMGGLVGSSQGIEDLIEKAGRQIADAIAEKRGVAKKVETAPKSLEPQIGSPQQETKAGKCQG